MVDGEGVRQYYWRQETQEIPKLSQKRVRRQETREIFKLSKRLSLNVMQRKGERKSPIGDLGVVNH